MVSTALVSSGKVISGQVIESAMTSDLGWTLTSTPRRLIRQIDDRELRLPDLHGCIISHADAHCNYEAFQKWMTSDESRSGLDCGMNFQ